MSKKPNLPKGVWFIVDAKGDPHWVGPNKPRDTEVAKAALGNIPSSAALALYQQVKKAGWRRVYCLVHRTRARGM